MVEVNQLSVMRKQQLLSENRPRRILSECARNARCHGIEAAESCAMSLLLKWLQHKVYAVWGILSSQNARHLQYQ